MWTISGRRTDAVDVVEGETDLDAGFVPPACWLVRPGKKAPMVLVPHWAKMVSMA
jgi:hypothetical protein